MAMADLTIMGAGAFGLSIALECARRGAKVRVCEKRAVGAGSSGGIVGALAPHTPENWNEKKAFQFDSLIAAEGFWHQVETLSGLSTGYARFGRLQPLADARALELAQARAVSAETLWQGKAQWKVVRQAGGWEPHSPTGHLVHDTLSARIHPRRACAALAKALVTLGGEIALGDTTAQGPTIWATGYEGLLALSGKMKRPIGNGVKGQAVLLQYNASGAPQLFADALHIVPHADGTVAVGSTSERSFETPDQTDAQLDDVLARAIAAFPMLRDAAVLERWAGVRPRAKSRAPILGHIPDRPGQFIANGGFKIGFGMAPKVAQVMADLVLDGQDNIPPDFKFSANL